MKEQDAFLNDHQKVAPKVIMSIETYQYIQENPETYDEIRSRMIQAEVDPLDDIKNFLKKW